MGSFLGFGKCPEALLAKSNCKLDCTHPMLILNHTCFACPGPGLPSGQVLPSGEEVAHYGTLASCWLSSSPYNHYAAGGWFCLYKKPKKLLKPWQMGTHMRVLSESYPMNTNMTGFRWFSKILVIWTKVASASEGISVKDTHHLLTSNPFMPGATKISLLFFVISNRKACNLIGFCGITWPFQC